MPLENVVVPGWETRLVEILLRCLSGSSAVAGSAFQTTVAKMRFRPGRRNSTYCRIWVRGTR